MTALKITAADMRSALKKVREELGPEAVILSNRKVPGGVEITASEDYQAVVSAHHQRENQQQRRQHKLPNVVDDGQVGLAPKRGDERHVLKSRADALATTQNQPRRELPTREALQAEIDRKLEKNRANQPHYRHDALFNRPVDANEPQELNEVNHAVDSFADELEGLLKNNSPQAQIDSRMAGAPNERYPQTVLGNDEILSVKRELHELKTMLSSQFNQMNWDSFGQQHPLTAAIFKRLRRMGLNKGICRSLMSSVDERLPQKQAWFQVLQALSQRIPVAADNIIDSTGVIAFVGPAGVGKTTTIAKLAAEYALKHGAENLALITTDGYRIAGHEQLRTLSQILKVPLRIVSEQQPLEKVVASLSHKRMIFIDTAGLNSADESFDHQMQLLANNPINMKTWLVLSSISQRRILEKTVKEYQHLDLEGSILTKLDESASLGEALSVIIENGLRLSYVTNGQKIPDDIQRPKPNRLVNMAVNLSKDVDDDDSEMADLFADMMAS